MSGISCVRLLVVSRSKGETKAKKYGSCELNSKIKACRSIYPESILCTVRKSTQFVVTFDLYTGNIPGLFRKHSFPMDYDCVLKLSQDSCVVRSKYAITFREKRCFEIIAIHTRCSKLSSDFPLRFLR